MVTATRSTRYSSVAINFYSVVTRVQLTWAVSAILLIHVHYMYKFSVSLSVEFVVQLLSHLTAEC